MTEIPDPIERGEARAARWEERIQGCMYTCSCGRTVSVNEVETLSPDPYAEPFCFRCCEAAHENKSPINE